MGDNICVPAVITSIPSLDIGLSSCSLELPDCGGTVTRNRWRLAGWHRWYETETMVDHALKIHDCTPQWNKSWSTIEPLHSSNLSLTLSHHSRQIIVYFVESWHREWSSSIQWYIQEVDRRGCLNVLAVSSELQVFLHQMITVILKFIVEFLQLIDFILASLYLSFLLLSKSPLRNTILLSPSIGTILVRLCRIHAAFGTLTRCDLTVEPRFANRMMFEFEVVERCWWAQALNAECWR